MSNYVSLETIQLLSETYFSNIITYAIIKVVPITYLALYKVSKNYLSWLW